MPLAATASQVANAAGYGPDDPLVVTIGRAGRRPAHLARGCFAPGAEGVVACAVDPGRGGPTTTTIVYLASLAKQVTAACAALLVRDGALDPHATVASILPGLPSWSHDVRIRHLVHHTGGLPRDGVTGADRTTAGVLAAARDLESPPGTRYSYSNAGYVCLAEVVGAVAGEPLPEFARRRVFAPLGMAATLFWAGPEPRPPGAAPLDPPRPAPLSIGDGGLWGTAADLLRWADGLTADRLGITAMMQTPGALDDGTLLDYAWGMGVRTYDGHTAYRHGGSYADVRTMLIRVPEKGLDLVVLALADRTDRSVALTDGLLPDLLA